MRDRTSVSADRYLDARRAEWRRLETAGEIQYKGGAVRVTDPVIAQTLGLAAPRRASRDGARERRRLVAARTCYVCLAPIAERQGVYHADLAILSHQGACQLVVTAERRVFDRSPRGRWRPRRDVLARLRLRRELEGPR